MAYYVGEIGININDFFEMTMQELHNISKGYQLKEEKQWLHTRQILTGIFQVNSKKRIKPSDIMSLSFDKQKTNMKPATSEEKIHWFKLAEQNARQLKGTS